MSTQKDRIENLEFDFQKLVEETTKRFADVDKSLENIAISIKEGFAKYQGESSRSHEKETKEEKSVARGSHNRDNRDSGQHFRPMKMEFPKLHEEDPIIWLDRVAQFLSTSPQLRSKKSHWRHSTWRARQTNGGNG
jgi:hypothetical protein